jgi:Fe-S-cluster containining protein
MPIATEYEKILANSRSKKKETKLFFDRLKKLHPGNLDAVTNEFHDKAFETINCLKCGNCCAATGPLLKSKDIDILAAEVRMKSPAFTEKFLRTDEDGDYVFKQLPCPFLADDNYCRVYSARPQACSEFPHTQMRNIHAKLSITYLNSMICPAVALVVEDLKQEFGK